MTKTSTTKQAEAMRAIEAAAKTDRDQARVLLGSLLARGAAAAPELAQANSALSDAQFATLADLLRLRAGPAQDAARLVLVEGKSVSAAAIDAGLPYPRAWQAVQRAQRGLKLAHSVCGVCATIQPSGLARR